jgi:hypothetical protein
MAVLRRAGTGMDYADDSGRGERLAESVLKLAPPRFVRWVKGRAWTTGRTMTILHFNGVGVFANKLIVLDFIQYVDTMEGTMTLDPTGI